MGTGWEADAGGGDLISCDVTPRPLHVPWRAKTADDHHQLERRPPRYTPSSHLLLMLRCLIALMIAMMQLDARGRSRQMLIYFNERGNHEMFDLQLSFCERRRASLYYDHELFTQRNRFMFYHNAAAVVSTRSIHPVGRFPAGHFSPDYSSTLT